MNSNAVDAGSGVNWLSEGWRLFVLNPGMWIALFVVYFIILFVLMWIPFVGKLAAALITPGLLAGMLTAARELDSGRDIKIETLFAPLQDESKRTPLLTLGAIYLAAVVALGLLMVLMGGAAALGGATMHGSGAGMVGLFGTLGIFALLLFLVWAAFASVVGYAVPLICFENVAPVDALKRSLSGLLQNIVPFLVFGIVALVLAVIASVPFMLGWLVLGPVLVGATYASYKQIFANG